MVLHDIIQAKQRAIQSKLAFLKSLASNMKKSESSLENALKNMKRPAFICEIKPRSPSEGVLRNDFDPLKIASIYAPFASAISVLADEQFFGGSLENVLHVSETVEVPVLFKDVIVSPWQVYEARHYGADAILLMFSVLDDADIMACQKIAHELNLDVLTEVHDVNEMERAKKFGAKIIGINNRDLKTLSIDLDTTLKLLPLAPKDAIIISESGFYKREQILRFKGLVHGFLVGSSLMKAKRIDLALRELIFGRVKICGFLNAEGAKLAYDLGAYYGGLNFCEHSKRRVDLLAAKKIIKAAPLLWGGIFASQPLEFVIEHVKALGLAFVQLHGNESKAYIADLKKHLKKCEIWRAVGVHDSMPVIDFFGADKILLDNGSSGGSGQSFDWRLLENIEDKGKIVLAGGINTANIAKASGMAFFAIDIASGAESAPGIKCAQKMAQLFENIRGG